jgi:hypothetical protein
LNQATLDFICCHARDDVRQLALQSVPADVNLREALTQIEGRQLAAHKLPSWATADGLRFPPRLSMEQCSSEATAVYKRQVAERVIGGRSLFVDLTAGLGVDFSHLAPLFEQAVYVDRNDELCALARHNMPLLGLPEAKVRCCDAAEALATIADADLIMIDPARRDAAGRKVALIEDCTPDVCAMQDALCQASRHILVKLSPMLDIAAALRALHRVAEVHVVSVGGECKELLFVLDAEARNEGAEKAATTDPAITCVNLPASNFFVFTRSEEAASTPFFADSIGAFLYEPHASILKAGAFKALCHRFGVAKLSQDAHLYTSDSLVADFPGRAWKVVDISSFSKKALRPFLADIIEADITVRGFPLSVSALRKQLRLREGGSNHLIATTLANGQRCIVKVKRV